MSLFVYRTLTPDKRRIRLINLLPKHAHIPFTRTLTEQLAKAGVSQEIIRVRCAILHVSLDQAPPYFALSYTWGDTSQKSIILVGDAPLYITKSLEAALAHLTPEDKPLTLWIDALCIDQNDEVEKTEQVQQMQQIYSQATSVLTWLGPAAENNDAAMTWIGIHGSLAYKFGIGSTPELRLERLLQKFEVNPDGLPQNGLKEFLQAISIELDKEPYEDGNVVVALSRLFKRPYWKRIWVVQEIVHAKSVQFVCGRMTVSEEPLHYSLRLLRNFENHLRYKSPQHPQAYGFGVESAVINTRTPISMLKIRRAAGPFPLIYLIRTLRYFNATDDRDKIFALLSYSADAKEFGIRPDYKKARDIVFLETTVSLLKNGFFDILSLCEAYDSFSGLPSWVPDFTRIGSRTPLQQRAVNRKKRPVTTSLQPNFNASGSIEHATASFADTETAFMTLLLKSKFVGEVKAVGTAWEPGAFQRWLRELKDLSQPSALSPETDILRAVWRTAVADQGIRRGDQKPRVSESAIENVHNLLRDVDLQTESKETFFSLGIGNYLHQLQDISRGRRPFSTSTGHLGIGPSKTEPGDFLYILSGADVPYILRKDNSGKLRLIGEAYAHRIMDGEAIKGDEVADMIKLY